MKKRAIATLLCVALFALLLPAGPARAEEKLSFVAVNDTLPPELVNAAAVFGGVTYVPYWLFTNYGLGVYYSYLSSAATAYLYNSEKQLFFDLSSGKTFDEDDYQYSASAIVRGGTVYLPLNFMYSYFGGFSYSNIAGNEYGSVLRITTGSEVLSNEEFLRAAKSAMRTHYLAYNKRLETGTALTPVPSAPQTSGEETPPHKGDSVRLGLRGLPSGQLLDYMKLLGITACFFLTAEEIRSDPDLVRRIACEGHSLGVRGAAGEAAELAEAGTLLTEAVRVRASLALIPPSAEPAAGMGTFQWSLGTDADKIQTADIYAVTASLDSGRGAAALLVPCGGDNDDALSALLFYLSDWGFSVTAPRATDGT